MSAIVGVRYIGEAPCPVRYGDRPFAPGEIITGPSDLIEALAARADFEPIHQIETAPAAEPAAHAPEKE